MKTPVVLILFNRPHLLRRVLERIAEAQPEKLFLIADGPRSGSERDHELCNEARRICSEVSWPSEIRRNFSQINLGCGRRISSGLDWVFARVDEAIILEDDCLPSLQFFRFCEEMLARYRDDRRIAIVSGDNFVAPLAQCRDSYYFSKYPHVWGWATWRRTWQLFDFQLSGWPTARKREVLKSVVRRPQTIRFWTDVLEDQYLNHSAWASRMVFTCFVNGMLNIVPEQNLVSNLGWGDDGTHTLNRESPLANLPIGRLDFPLRHPEHVVQWLEADEMTEAAQFSAAS